VLVAPAVGEPLAESGASDLPAQLCLEAAAGLAGAAGHRALDGAPLPLHFRLERAGDGGDELQA